MSNVGLLMRTSPSRLKCGFTLIEVSIVLVIIGLIVGGVLVGQDLIVSATVRAQIAQIEKYQTAVNTFRSKYGYLPGDIPDPFATRYGFAPRGTQAGQGDGNGIIEASVFGANGQPQWNGETALLWVDLSQANLIDGSFTTVTSATYYPPGDISGANINLYLPPAKIGHGAYVYVWSGGPVAGGFGNPPNATNGISYYAVEAISLISSSGACPGCVEYAVYPNGNPIGGLSVQQAYNIDKKIDDGFPQSGRVTAMVADPVPGYWGKWVGDADPSGGPVVSGDGVTTTPSATTCYDNNGNGGTEYYSLSQNGGTGLNCALSFQFQ